MSLQSLSARPSSGASRSSRIDSLSALAFLIFATAALWVRPPLAIDETRYLAVAWNSYVTDNHLLLSLNGAIYTDKTPLFFALIEEIWDVTGPNQILARLVPVLFGAATILLVRLLAGLLSYNDALPVGCPHWILAGLPMFVIFGQAMLFDTMLATGTVIAVIGVVAAAHGRMKVGSAVVLAGVAFGFASKGPVILLHTVPVALLAPLWVTGRLPVSRTKWVLIMAAAILAGVILNGAWIVPDFVSMSTHSGWNLVWTQTFGRVAGKFGHPRPFWYFLALLPIIMLPWTLSRPFWSRSVCRRALRSESVRLGLVWFVSALVLHSLSSGKQAYYLLPSLPGAALVLAGLVESAKAESKDALYGPLVASALLMLAGAATFLVAALFPLTVERLVGFDIGISIVPALALLVCGFACLRIAGRPAHWRLAAGIVLGLCAMLLAQMSFLPIWQQNDPRLIVDAVPNIQKRPLAWVKTYNGEITFAAERTAPVEVLDNVGKTATWLKMHPTGVVIAHTAHKESPVPGVQTSFLRWRGDYLAIMESP